MFPWPILCLLNFFLLNFLVGVGHPWEHENLTRGQSSSKENDSLSSETIHSQEHLSGAGSSLSFTPPHPMLAWAASTLLGSHGCNSHVLSREQLCLGLLPFLCRLRSRETILKAHLSHTATLNAHYSK